MLAGGRHCDPLRATFDACMSPSVSDTVRKQAEAEIDNVCCPHSSKQL